jgi:plasmid stabilization system protein ParE
MARLYRSPRAKRDIADVLEYTRDRWGLAQARAYRDLIREALKSIAADPKCGKPRGARPGILATTSNSQAEMSGTSCSIG